MTPETIDALGSSLGKIGAVAAISLAAVGSALGTGAAGMAAVGAWKKCYLQNKTAPFMLLAFVGAPLTQTIYGLIVTLRIIGAADASANAFPALIAWGLLGGLAMGMSAWMQGRTAAGASDALGETGQGFVNYLISLGIIETVALFVMVMILIAL
jgi:V/A-type H+-transporting ATPase subunit K